MGHVSLFNSTFLNALTVYFPMVWMAGEEERLIARQEKLDFGHDNTVAGSYATKLARGK